jgi:hypothetical protein
MVSTSRRRASNVEIDEPNCFFQGQQVNPVAADQS